MSTAAKLSSCKLLLFLFDCIIMPDCTAKERGKSFNGRTIISLLLVSCVYSCVLYLYPGQVKVKTPFIKALSVCLVWFG